MKNFDRARKGEMLQNFYDFKGQLGVAYQRCIDFDKDYHSLDQMVICFPRGATVAVSEGKNHIKFINDQSNIIIKKAGFKHKVWSETKVYDDLALFPSKGLIEKVWKNFSYPKGQLQVFLSHVGTLERSLWLDSLIQQFFLRRVVYKESASSLSFFESEIIREIIQIFLKRKNVSKKIFFSSEFEDIIDFIESNLFSEMDIDNLSRRFNLSSSSLNRSFRNNIEISPRQYIQRRRLEEAMKLIKSTKSPIQEISYLIGYENVSSFIRAFKKQYRHSPAHFRN